MVRILEDLCHKLTTGSEYSLKMEESLKDTLALWEEEMEEIIKSNHIQ